MLNSSWHMNLSLGVYTGWALRYKLVVPKAPRCFFQELEVFFKNTFSLAGCRFWFNFLKR